MALHADHHVSRCDVGLHAAGRGFGITELQDHTRLFKPTHRALIMHIEGSQTLDFIIEHFHTQRLIGLPGIEVEDAATTRELPALCDLRRTIIACI